MQRHSGPITMAQRTNGNQAARTPLETLIAIASYGTSQDRYLAKLITEFGKVARIRPRVVVLSNVQKAVGGAEVAVGLPSRNPYSLPFAHRKLFAEHAGDHDLFIYSEDDTLIGARQIEAFLEVQERLEEDEIAGFIRSEQDRAGRRFITSIHHHFRWRPESVIERGGELFASLTNEHSGCFMATRKQLERAIASGGFLVPPHSERYGMLETAASDIYTQCGLRRLICLSRIEDFIVPHLPNKYFTRMGIPIEELELQARTLRELYTNGGWTGKLFEPESGAPDFRWSKDLYEQPDEQLLGAIPSTAKSVLSVGCGWGGNEAWLSRNGLKVCAVPLDAVFEAALRKRGIRTVAGPLDEALEGLGGERFDAVLLADVLHLVEEPVEWLRRLRDVLGPGGGLIASVPNTGDFSLKVRDWREGRTRGLAGERNGAGHHQVDVRRLRNWCRKAGLRAIGITPLLDGSERPWRRWGAALMGARLASRFILTASRRESNG